MKQDVIRKSEDEEGVGNILFLIGAGGSIPCGIPGMNEFLDVFLREEELNAEERNLADTLLRITGKNLELFLEKLSSISEIAKDEQLQKLIIDSSEDRSRILSFSLLLEEKLLRFIRRKCTDFNTIRATEVYSSLFQLLEKLKLSKMHIFSLNYDTCIEEVCKMKEYRERGKWDMSTGFSTREGFKEIEFEDCPICLYKLHGSVTWFKGKKIVMEVPTEEFASMDKVATPMLIYPALNKYDIYMSPFAELFEIFRKMLRDSTVCIAIGYSFGDLHIKSLLNNAITHNEDLVLVVVSPSASTICGKELENFKRVLPIDDIMKNACSMLSISCIRAITNAFKKTDEAVKSEERIIMGKFFAEAAEILADHKFYNGAIEYGRKAFELGFKKITRSLGEWYSRLSEKYLELRKLEESRQVLLEAIKWYNRIDSPSLGITLSIAEAYEKLNLLEKAYKVYKNAVELYESEENKEEIEKIREKIEILEKEIRNKYLVQKSARREASKKFSDVELKKGNCYLARNVEDTYLFFSDYLKEFRGLCISSEPEAVITDRYSLENVDFIKIGTDIQNNFQDEEFQQNIFEKVERFVRKENENGIILIDSISCFFVSFLEEKAIYRFIYRLNDLIRSWKSTLFVVIQDESSLPRTFGTLRKDFIDI